ncbi:nuclear transport factor 2 family protein [Streptomyces sp. NPDC091281]|uniref:nuclear transport factor 2 family protein n=1 Tax=Streptomyces sp. NPDC091281 TaxID=3365985 RepID=UPI00380CE1B0
MDPIEQLLAERACQRLLLDLVRRFDHGEPGSVAELFTEDGTWAWPAGDRLVRGRAALRTYFGAHPARSHRGTGSGGTGTGTGLVMSSVQVEVTSPDTASATSYFTAFLLGGVLGADRDAPAHSHARGAGPAPAARTPYTPYTSRAPHAPAPAPAPVRIGHYEDRFHRSPAHGGTWLLERRTVFLPPDAPPPPL